jgi:hypothetical protein
MPHSVEANKTAKAAHYCSISHHVTQRNTLIASAVCTRTAYTVRELVNIETSEEYHSVLTYS